MSLLPVFLLSVSLPVYHFLAIHFPAFHFPTICFPVQQMLLLPWQNHHEARRAPDSSSAQMFWSLCCLTLCCLHPALLRPKYHLYLHLHQTLVCHYKCYCRFLQHHIHLFSTQQRNFRIQECRDQPLHCLQISSGLCQ